ncbi:MAG: alpha/beta hydrolase [Desulfobulbus sp.]|nr:alpha/beta hydrolase [Desulfobulbus sp.]
MKHLTIAGCRLEYRDIPAAAENRPPLLLLHEGLGSVAMWRHFPDKLAAATGCRVIVWSRAGYGGSQPWPQAFQPDYMHREAQQALPELLTALGIERPVLIGHSDGGSIALIFAGTFPATPRALVLLAPHVFVEELTVASIDKARMAWASTDLPQKLGRYHQQVEQVFRNWNDIWLSPAFRDWNIEEYLPRIICPVLAIQGEDDEYGTMRQIEAIVEQVPGARLIKLAACGHSPQRDQEAAVLAALSEFIAGL